MKKSAWIKLHLYCGLFTSFYLIAFGVSSLILNHKISVGQSEVAKTWTTQVQLDPKSTDQELAEGLWDQIGLMGWTTPWQFRRDSAGFSCAIVHLAKESSLHLDFQSGESPLV